MSITKEGQKTIAVNIPRIVISGKPARSFIQYIDDYWASQKGAPSMIARRAIIEFLERKGYDVR